MRKDKIRSRVRSVISSISKINEFKDDDDIFEKGIIDSLAAIKLICRLEEEFRIKIAQDEIKKENLKSIQDMVALIKNKIQGG